MSKIVAVFGSARVKPDMVEYQDTYRVGNALAKAGYAVMTGGYEGAMEAASKGASEAGGHVIGVASTPIELLRTTKPNQWVKEVIIHNTLYDRLLYMVKSADAYVVMPGGLGTLNELILSWELIRVKDITPRALVCYGNFWKDILIGLEATTYLDARDWGCVQYAYSPEDVVNAISSFEQNQ